MQKLMIGLEIHGYLDTKEKLFCKCKRTSESTLPNKNICPICTGQPGSKPNLPNAEAIKKTSGRLSSNNDIFICAPPAMIKALKEQFVAKGISKKRLHSEEFNF